MVTSNSERQFFSPFVIFLDLSGHHRIQNARLVQLLVDPVGPTSARKSFLSNMQCPAAARTANLVLDCLNRAIILLYAAPELLSPLLFAIMQEEC